MNPSIASTNPGQSSRGHSASRRKAQPSAVARLRAACKIVRSQLGAFERSLRISIITDPMLETTIPTLLNTGTEIMFNRHYLRQVADGGRKLQDILTIEFSRAVTVALCKRARGNSKDDSGGESARCPSESAELVA
jgi:hypothetical protein